jgi:hypothetical protein
MDVALGVCPEKRRPDSADLGALGAAAAPLVRPRPGVMAQSIDEKVSGGLPPDATSDFATPYIADQARNRKRSGPH